MNYRYMYLFSFFILNCIYESNATSVSRRHILKSGAVGGLSWFVRPKVGSSIINGAEVSQAEAASAGAVGLWIDLKNCDVCRHDVPAACSGVLIAPDLILSAKHCVEIPESLNGTLERAIFSNNIFDLNAPSIPIIDFKKASEYGVSAAGDLLLIKLARRAPPNWIIQRLSFNFRDYLMQKKTSIGASTQYDELINRDLMAYGYGDTTDDFFSYSSGVLKRLIIRPTTNIFSEFFYTLPKNKSQGTCHGDSGGAAILQPKNGKGSPVILGILSSTSMPCAGSSSAFVNPDAFREFIVRASADLGSPISVTDSSNWEGDF